MFLALELPGDWLDTAGAVAALLAGLFAARMLTRMLERTPSAAGWILVRVGLLVAAFGLLMWFGVVPHEPAFPADGLGLAVGALVGGGVSFMGVGRALTSKATRERTGVRIAVPVRPTPPATDTAFTLPAGGYTTRRASTGVMIGAGSR
jgi:drug/metabolite transporter (DMT)-like permease